MNLDKDIFKKRFEELFFDKIYKIRFRLNFSQNGKNFHRKLYFNKSGEFLADYDQNSKYFWFSVYEIWSILGSEFTLNYEEMRGLIKDILEVKYNLKGITTTRYWK